MRGEDEEALIWMQTWAIAWGGVTLTRTPDRITALRTLLFENWIRKERGDLSFKSGWALGRIPLVGTCFSDRPDEVIKEFLNDAWKLR